MAGSYSTVRLRLQILCSSFSLLTEAFRPLSVGHPQYVVL